MDKLRQVLSGNEANNEETEGFAAAAFNSTTLNMSTRIKWFAIFFVLGFVLSILGTALIFLPRGLIIFALFYTLGNVCSMASTMFLMGPWKQLKKMFSEKRIISTVLVILFMVLTLLSALKWHKTMLAVIFCILQFVAFVYYSISYIPYAHDAVHKAMMSCV